MEVIRSAANPRLKRARQLARRRSARVDEGCFVVEGAKLLLEASAAGLELTEVFVDSESVTAADRQLLDRYDGPITEVGPGLIARIGASASPPPVLAVVRTWPADLAALPSGLRRVLVLVEVADPGNLGTLLRCAEASGVDAVALAGESVDPFNPKVVRASAGSLFRVPVALEPDPSRALEGLRTSGLRLVGTDAARGVSYDEAALGAGVAIVLGNESHGLSGPVAAAIEEWVRIPLRGDVESLNVAMAGAVLCFEGLRQENRAASLDERR